MNAGWSYHQRNVVEQPSIQFNFASFARIPLDKVGVLSVNNQRVAKINDAVPAGVILEFDSWPRRTDKSLFRSSWS
jgi:hypothetical protein